MPWIQNPFSGVIRQNALPMPTTNSRREVFLAQPMGTARCLRARDWCVPEEGMLIASFVMPISRVETGRRWNLFRLFPERNFGKSEMITIEGMGGLVMGKMIEEFVIKTVS